MYYMKQGLLLILTLISKFNSWYMNTTENKRLLLLIFLISILFINEALFVSLMLLFVCIRIWYVNFVDEDDYIQ